ncbi:atrial natriuretic peptide receptor 1-like [Liolophura sinensis]|uniref:atrial natriuretic peptide receptor 1-like n=1 Tax=Liolophura sinensis TaxID=3198878 RepID=UPI0031588A30
MIQASNQVFIEVGKYKENLVAVKMVHKETLTPSRSDLIELKQMCEMKQENLSLFIGACIDPPHICVLYQYCPKGSLQDILENDDIKLDWVFKYSLISDIVNGMTYLHSSPLKSHGRLKSTNCVVDSRWLLKITDYGLNNMLQGQTSAHLQGEYEQHRRMLWTAPEILRQSQPPPNGTQTGDVYSFGIILHEVCFRLGVFGSVKNTPKEIIENIRNATVPPFRPPLHEVCTNVDQYLIVLMDLCWNELPQRRPDFQAVKRILKNHNKGHKGNIMDNMLKMMEKYANNLEDLVEQRTQELVQEKKKTDKLLYRLLPPLVAEKLKKGQTVDPELFPKVTIYFSDIVGFTTISAQCTPMQVVDLLNQLYTLFDDIIALHDVYKVETIGDAYMVVSGVPVRNGDHHTRAIADMALDILSALMFFTVPHMPQQKLKIRIGAHTGACCAGVVGLTMPRYCLFGDTVNTASRMESNGEGQRIHISEETCKGLQQTGKYKISPRGEINIKGKGMMQTYWLEGKEGFNKKLPDPTNN